MDEKANSTNMHHGATPEIFRNAETLRNQMTEAERVLWEALREKQLYGFKFRRQHPVNKYVLDFYCHQAGWQLNWMENAMKRMHNGFMMPTGHQILRS